MALTDIWFLLIAVLWTGYFVLEGFDFGVGMLLRVLGRDRERPPRADQHHRPGVGRQRGVADRRRRRHVRRVPRVVRDPVLRLLPAAAAHPGRADRARGRLRVPRQDRRRPAGGATGTARSSPARWSRRCCGAWPSATSCAASRSTPTTSSSAPSSPAQPLRAARRAATLTLFTSPRRGVPVASRPTATSGCGRARLAPRLGAARGGRRRRLPALDAARPRRRPGRSCRALVAAARWSRRCWLNQAAGGLGVRR